MLQDSDLQILQRCSNEQLKSLLDIIVFDDKGKKRLTETLSAKQEFLSNYPSNIKALIPNIIDEIQKFGGNTIFNVLRGHGVKYREILEDVCDKLKVNYNKNLSTDLLENELLRKVAVTAIEKMSEEDIKKFDQDLDKKRILEAILNNNGPIMTMVIAGIVSQLTRQTGVRGVAMLFGRQLGAKVVAIAVPALNVIAALWTVMDIASPAYRVTVPFTITLAFIRRSLNSPSEELKEIFA